MVVYLTDKKYHNASVVIDNSVDSRAQERNAAADVDPRMRRIAEQYASQDPYSLVQVVDSERMHRRPNKVRATREDPKRY